MFKNLKFTVKDVIYWILGLVLCALGVALCTKAGFGLSMIGASPYIISVYMRQFFSWYTQGNSEYIWQALLLIIMCLIIFRFKLRYILSFVTAILAGKAIDFWLFVLGGDGLYSTMTYRIIAFIIGTILLGLAIAFIFRTCLPIQVYELMVKEISERYKLNRDKFKLFYDIGLFVIALALSFILTKKLTGIGVGTVIITFVNAPLITGFGKIIDKTEGKINEKRNRQ